MPKKTDNKKDCVALDVSLTQHTATAVSGSPSQAELARVWDLVIRAHYLALEMGDAGNYAGLGAARMALSLSEVLSSWATLCGAELEALEKTPLEEESCLPQVAVA